MSISNTSLQCAYQSIGQSLLSYEAKSKHINSDVNFAFNELREDLAFIQVEILESYLEDLLNIRVSDDVLFISKEKKRLLRYALDFTIISTALSAGLFAVYLDASKLIAFLVTFLVALPLTLIYKLSPLMIQRRMALARVLSKEIARRRGRDDDDQARNRIALKDFFIRQGSSGMQGIAKINMH